MTRTDKTTNESSASKILVVDDHLLFADGLELLLSQADDAYEVVISSEAEKVISDANFLSSFDLLLVDLHMPTLNGFNFIKAISVQNIPLKVIAVSGTEEKAEIERAVRLGAMGFIPKDSPTDQMLRGIRQVLSGQRYLPPQYEGEINWESDAPPIADSSDAVIGEKQLEVLRMMRDGMQNRQIATVLGVSVSGVKRHIEILFKALNVNNRTACVQQALKQKLL